MMNQNQGVWHALQQSTLSPISTLSAIRRVSFSRKAKKLCAHLAVLAALLVVGAINSHAQADFTYTNTAAFGTWNVGSAWVTNGGNSGEYPGDPLDPSGLSFVDGAYLTNAGTFYVKFTGNVSLGSNFFSNASGTVSQVTLDLSTFNYALGEIGNAIVIGNSQGSTTIVYLASSTQAQGGIASQGAIVVGRNGVGSLFFTNGFVATLASSANVSLGTGGGGHGTLVVTGPNTILNDLRQMSVGSATNLGGGANSVVISNSASLTVGSSLRIGSGSGGGSSSNTFFVDNNAQVSFGAGHAVLGKRGGTQGSYDNIMAVRGGAGIIFNNHSFGVGWSDDDTGPGTGSVFTVTAGSSATNISVLNLRPANTINLYGGTLGGDFNATSNGNIVVEGLFRGFGTVKGSMTIISNGTLAVSNTTAALTIQRDLLMTNPTATVQMALGTSFNTVPVGHNILLSGKLNLIDGGGFTTTTYPLFTYANNLISTNNDGSGTTNAFITIGTTPDNSKTYTIDTNTPGQVNLIVSGVATLPFQITSITRSGANITVNWNTKGSVGQTNFLQASPGAGVSRSYPGTFVDIATNVIAGTTATFTDVSGVTGATNKYYRIRSPQ